MCPGFQMIDGISAIQTECRFFNAATFQAKRYTGREYGIYECFNKHDIVYSSPDLGGGNMDMTVNW
jgi:hypothetical protein